MLKKVTKCLSRREITKRKCKTAIQEDLDELQKYSGIFRHNQAYSRIIQV